MAADLAGIDKLIEQHNEVRRNLRLVGDQVADMEAFFDLQRAYAAWSQSSLEELTQKRALSLQTINQLEEGLKNHFEVERENLIPLLGETLAEGLELEHNEITGRLSELKTAVTNPGFERMSPSQLTAEKGRIERMVRGTLEAIEQHAGTEDGVMKMLRRSLLAREK